MENPRMNKTYNIVIDETQRKIIELAFIQLLQETETEEEFNEIGDLEDLFQDLPSEEANLPGGLARLLLLKGRGFRMNETPKTKPRL
jgi:hypothetical protein